ncbi:MAG TPA: hypothetical protein VGI64_04800 [Streptosporangiaceae bacterium]|jgi:hypothetical protein
MSFALLQSAAISLPVSPFPPLALGFFGLGTGYLIYGTQELFGYPKRSETVDFATGMWGIWMPGFLQFLTGTYLFLGLTLFGTFTDPPLFMAALAFTAYGVHWFALGWNRLHRADPKTNVGMTVAFTLISVLGIIVFFKSHDDPVGGLFIGLTCIYVSDFFVSFRDDLPRFSGPADRMLGFFRLGTGFWLMYLVFADMLNTILKYTLPL